MVDIEIISPSRFKERIDPFTINIFSQKFSHIFRYFLAGTSLLENLRDRTIVVLDIGCGTGYGSWMLSRLMKFDVVSTDINIKSLTYAKKRFRIDKCINCDVRLLPFRDKVFKAILLLEVIEHVREHYSVFKEIRRVLAEDGIVIVSTPNKQVEDIWELILKIISFLTKFKFTLKNPYHIGELGYKEFIKVAERNGFKVIKSYGLFILPGFHKLLPKNLAKIIVLAPLKTPSLALDVIYILTKF